MSKVILRVEHIYESQIANPSSSYNSDHLSPAYLSPVHERQQFPEHFLSVGELNNMEMRTLLNCPNYDCDD